MHFVNKLLNKLARRIVGNAESCTFWNLHYGKHFAYWSFLGRGHLTANMQREFPRGGWSWWRLFEMMDMPMPRRFEPKDSAARLGQ